MNFQEKEVIFRIRGVSGPLWSGFRVNMEARNRRYRLVAGMRATQKESTLA